MYKELLEKTFKYDDTITMDYSDAIKCRNTEQFKYIRLQKTAYGNLFYLGCEETGSEVLICVIKYDDESNYDKLRSVLSILEL